MYRYGNCIIMNDKMQTIKNKHNKFVLALINYLYIYYEYLNF